MAFVWMPPNMTSTHFIRIVAKTLGATINDVLMASMGGFTRRYLELLKDPAIMSGKPCRVRANMAISLAKTAAEPVKCVHALMLLRTEPAICMLSKA
jgi:hypothetical protein